VTERRRSRAVDTVRQRLPVRSWSSTVPRTLVLTVTRHDFPATSDAGAEMRTSEPAARDDAPPSQHAMAVTSRAADPYRIPFKIPLGDPSPRKEGERRDATASPGCPSIV
jgi:hypothetical protein